MLHTSFLAVLCFPRTAGVGVSPGSQPGPAPALPLGVHICSPCLCVFLPPLRPFPLVFFPKGKGEWCQCRTRSPLLPSLVFFWDFCHWVFRLAASRIFRLGLWDPLAYFSISCLERCLPSRRRPFRIKGTSPPCSPQPPPSGTGDELSIPRSIS